MGAMWDASIRMGFVTWLRNFSRTWGPRVKLDERAIEPRASPVRAPRDGTKLSNMAHQDFDKSRAAALSRQVGTDFGAALTVALAYIGERVGLWRAIADGSSM